jgi:hypothetical protein
MTARPSVKGRIFAPAVEDVQKLLANGTLRRGELTRWLAASDLPYLDHEPLGTEWYDIAVYARLLELLRDVEGEGKNEYLRRRGMRTAERLMEAGLYAQLEYLNRLSKNELSDPRERFHAFGRDLRLLTSISSTIFNFAKWEVKPDPELDLRYRIDVSEARDFPEPQCWTTDGFVNRMAAQHGDAELWSWERPRADLVVWRMIRAL